MVERSTRFHEEGKDSDTPASFARKRRIATRSPASLRLEVVIASCSRSTKVVLHDYY